MKIALLPLALLVTAPATASDWTLDRDASSVTFETTVLDAPVTGQFEDFEAAIRLDPENLSEAHIDASVTIASGGTSNPSYTGEMLGEPGLAPQAHPTASFMSHSVAASEECDTCYVASGDLSIRGETRPIDLPFTLTIDADRAVAEGQFVVRRADFGIGGSSWGSSAREVTVILHIEADRAQ
ncbi:MAG: hypothetical protein CMF74_08725 [Maricaulis sp.]|jgi:cytochrome b561|nr:hypothetical protein [Maricaulis sp.]HAQ35094.1 hypothetical protein [Alphaproteobacteria bacterium]